MLNNSLLYKTTTVVFIDSSVSDYQTLQTGVVEGVETIILSPNKDGIEEITEFLQQYPQITNIHIVSHGSPGCLYLGNSQLNLNNIGKYTELLQRWQSQSILLYGCNVAAGDAGEEFIRKLHEITNATVSASATKTGNTALGGNWELEVNIPTDVETFHGTSLHYLSDIVFLADTLNTYQGVFAPTLIGVWDRLSYAYDVTVVGNYAYAVGDTLDIIDISDPNNPVLKGSYDISNGRSVKIVGNYAYVADGYSGLQIINISNPAAPTLVGNYDTNGNALDVEIVGNYAYVADSTSGMQIINISNPAAPTLIGNYDTNGSALDVEIVGNYAYVADGDSYLEIINISNPAAPTLIGNYYTSGDEALDVEIVGNYAYVASFSYYPIDEFTNDYNSHLNIFDISNPTEPIFKGYYYLDGKANDVQIVGNYAYVTYTEAYNFSSGLEIIDISNPTEPVFKGNYASYNSANGVQVVGNYAYVTNDITGLEIIDISNPTTPTLVGNYDNGFARGVQVVGNYAYVADGDAGLEIIDISNPTTPIFKGNYDTSGYARDVQIVGNYAYVADGYSGLQIIDISNPTSPTLVGNYDNGFAEDVQIVGNYAYVADGTSGLQIIDISNPTSPILKGNYATFVYALDVQIVGNYAYVADGTSGLQIINISNPTTPTLVGNYDTSDFAVDVEIVGNYAYVADGTSGLQIINISNPAAPTLVGNYHTSNYAFDVEIVGNYAYVADGYSGLQIINISNPAAPTLVGYHTSNYAVDVEIVGNYAYVADSADGLKIIDVSEFTNPITNQAPTNLTLSNSNIAENQPIATVVGNFTTTDPDIGNTFTYSLVSGTGSTNNSLFTISGTQLKTQASFNFEAKNSYSIRVRTQDQDGLFYEKQLTIIINNIAENAIIGTAANNILNGTANADRIDGLDGSDTLYGLAGNDDLYGGNGDDTLNGGTGADALIGGAGNDFYFVDNIADTITEAANAGTDAVFSTVTYTLANNVENLTLQGTAAINGTGNTLNNVLTGNAAANTLSGGAGADTLNGGAGADALIGSVGNDSYYVDNAGDVITEIAGEGTDAVFSTVTYTLANNVENLTLQGTAAINGTGNTLNNVLTGNTATNILDGKTGADTLIGGLGNDSYYVDNAGDIITEAANAGTDAVFSTITYTLANNVENLTLQGTAAINGTGNTLNNVLTGNTAANILDGKTGADTLIGGLGNDSYYVDNAGDIITEAANAGTDAVFSTITYTLANNVENLTLQGTAAINGTGNTLNNVLTGNTAANTLTGGAGIDTLTGNAGADTLIGGLGNDIQSLGLNDNAVDIVKYALNDGADTITQFVRGVGGDKFQFTGIANIDVVTSGANTLLRIGDGTIGNTGFGTGQLLATLSGTSGFNSANFNVNLFGANFLFS
ncbi:DUF4347 domain-containing protein [Anabaena catenula]|uniref:DUF4347 domain-containing protein n=1 Tax=Anabaena catenula FACHB-362 TaxID=2692877 RepID=A0ABR8J159_9NOST|nr:DUF4347 domain-containing protein [Anabaena catenula]MBD2692064.1 DUF4347 domain-containing protein [Anabaena catenula FACHB-362]